MRDLLQRLYGVVRKEIVQLLRQPGLLTILVIGPLAILLLFGAGVRPVDPAVSVAFVVPEDNPDLQGLVEEFAEAQEGRLLVHDIGSNEAAAESALRRDEVQVIISVPDVRLDDLTSSEEQPVLRVRHSFLDPLEAQAISLLTDGAVSDINDRIVEAAIAEVQGVAEALLEESAQQEEAAAAAAEGGLDEREQAQVEAGIEEAQELFDRDPALLAAPLDGEAEAAGGAITTSEFYAPAVVALILQHLTITFVALSISRERSQGTVELLAVSPLRPAERLAGKVLAYLLIGLVLGAVLLAAVVLVLGAPMRSGVLPVAGVLGLALVASIGVGFVLSAISRTTTQVVQGAMLILLLSVFFGGLLLSPERLFAWARPVGWLLPMYHAIPGLRDSMLRGVPIATTPLLALAAIAVVTLAGGGIWSARRREPTG
ncbi:ABC transporter permease [Euzebya tangerina]|uniref:ABC transporter permease n=1 Tax=Euzebya tangerina TaxID=591198 RepID=UPI0013C34F05|nr:ABC transporter permease [Euzebya tangerina]